MTARDDYHAPRIVTRDQLAAFLAAYPRPLDRHVVTITDPPLVEYLDDGVVVATRRFAWAPGDAEVYRIHPRPIL